MNQELMHLFKFFSESWSVVTLVGALFAALVALITRDYLMLQKRISGLETTMLENNKSADDSNVIYIEKISSVKESVARLIVEVNHLKRSVESCNKTSKELEEQLIGMKTDMAAHRGVMHELVAQSNLLVTFIKSKLDKLESLNAKQP